MSRTNCLLPSSGFCLNLRVRMVNSGMAEGLGARGRGLECRCARVNPWPLALEPKWLEP